MLAFKDIIGIVSLATGMCPITKHYTLDIWTKPSRKFITVGKLNSKQRHNFNIFEKSTNGVLKHKVSKVPQIFNLSLEDEGVPNVTTTAGNQNVFADDSQRTGNIFEKSTNKQPHGVFEHQVPEVPQIFNLSLEDERVTNITTTADDQNVFADDSQQAGNEKIIDEWDDVGSFGIMSIYCNSEIHSGYARVSADDTTGSVQLK
ncbi:uncharacterized protein LOC132735269 isoform X2 [Ruditapes philippinarum]|uniref:uncharacterized protein LOC132735269 isoform X2 n=1 Tax=Ruditapes philippinarum TaxID=129788 RepID=UPI00295C2BC5|nr:uncharacterized protein LOC132735269 isoform X2 [Ruditapes philippinarum]